MSRIDAYIADHNAAVRSGDWRTFASWFTDDAEVAFVGVPVGPFRGREDIRAAYESRPPDDEVEIRNVREEGELTRAEYGWKGEPGTGAGELQIRWRGDCIDELVISFD